MARILGIVVVLAVALLSTAAFADGKRARFGFSTDAKTSGGFFSQKLESVSISRVSADSPAMEAGLLAGDVIIAANEKPIAGSSISEFQDLLRSFAPGDHLRLKVERTGKEMAIDIVAGSK